MGSSRADRVLSNSDVSSAGVGSRRRRAVHEQVRHVRGVGGRDGSASAVLAAAYTGGIQEAVIPHAAMDDSDRSPDGDVLRAVSDRHQPRAAGLGRAARDGGRLHLRAIRQDLHLRVLHHGGAQPPQADHGGGGRAPLPTIRKNQQGEERRLSSHTNIELLPYGQIYLF